MDQIGVLSAGDTLGGAVMQPEDVPVGVVSSIKDVIATIQHDYRSENSAEFTQEMRSQALDYWLGVYGEELGIDKEEFRTMVKVWASGVTISGGKQGSLMFGEGKKEKTHCDSSVKGTFVDFYQAGGRVKDIREFLSTLGCKFDEHQLNGYAGVAAASFFMFVVGMKPETGIVMDIGEEPRSWIRINVNYNYTLSYYYES